MATEQKIAKVEGFVFAISKSADLRNATDIKSQSWYAGITANMFGIKA